MVTRILIVLEIAVLILGATKRVGATDPPPSGSDRDDVKLKARVALALAEADAAAKARVAATAKQLPMSPAVAPMPRIVANAKLTYSAGYRLASVEQLPLVIFVNCDLPAPAPSEAVSSKTTCFADTCGPAVIVGYPVGGRLYIDARLTGRELTAERVETAVKSAAKKIEIPVKEMPREKLAPVPLDYQIKADVPGTNVAGCGSCGGACACGPACKCPPGACPGGCPDVLTPTPPEGYHAEVGVDGKTWWVRDGLRFSHNVKVVATKGEGVEPAVATPFAASPLTIPITPATPVRPNSGLSSGSYRPAVTSTPAHVAAGRGSIGGDGCPPAG